MKFIKRITVTLAFALSILFVGCEGASLDYLSESVQPEYDTLLRPGTPDETNGVFVSPSGSDSTGEGTIASPYATILKGTHVARNQGKSLFVAAGTYNEYVWVKSNIYCGYDSGFTTYDPANNVTLIQNTDLTKSFTLFVGDEHDSVSVDIHGCKIKARSHDGVTRALVVRGKANLEDTTVVAAEATGVSGISIAVDIKGMGYLSATTSTILLANSTGNSIGVRNTNGTAEITDSIIEFEQATMSGGTNHSIGVLGWAAAILTEVQDSTIDFGANSDYFAANSTIWNVAVDSSPLVLKNNTLLASLSSSTADNILLYTAPDAYRTDAEVNLCPGSDASCTDVSGNYDNITTYTVYISQDTYASNLWPDDNSMGYWSSLQLNDSHGVYFFRPYLGFNSSGWNNEEVLSATLMVEYDTDGGMFSETSANMYSITGQWTENSLTWNNQPTVGPYLRTESFNGWSTTQIDITSIAQDVLDGQSTGVTFWPLPCDPYSMCDGVWIKSREYTGMFGDGAPYTRVIVTTTGAP